MFQVKYNFVDHIHPKNIFKFAYFSARPVLTSHWPAFDYSKEHRHPNCKLFFQLWDYSENVLRVSDSKNGAHLTWWVV